jgi:hypothetical protein
MNKRKPDKDRQLAERRLAAVREREQTARLLATAARDHAIAVKADQRRMLRLSDAERVAPFRVPPSCTIRCERQNCGPACPCHDAAREVL